MGGVGGLVLFRPMPRAVSCGMVDESSLVPGRFRSRAATLICILLSFFLLGMVARADTIWVECGTAYGYSTSSVAGDDDDTGPNAPTAPTAAAAALGDGSGFCSTLGMKLVSAICGPLGLHGVVARGVSLLLVISKLEDMAEGRPVAG